MPRPVDVDLGREQTEQAYGAGERAAGVVALHRDHVHQPGAVNAGVQVGLGDHDHARRIGVLVEFGGRRDQILHRPAAAGAQQAEAGSRVDLEAAAAVGGLAGQALDDAQEGEVVIVQIGEKGTRLGELIGVGTGRQAFQFADQPLHPGQRQRVVVDDLPQIIEHGAAIGFELGVGLDRRQRLELQMDQRFRRTVSNPDQLPLGVARQPQHRMHAPVDRTAEVAHREAQRIDQEGLVGDHGIEAGQRLPWSRWRQAQQVLTRAPPLRELPVPERDRQQRFRRARFQRLRRRSLVVGAQEAAEGFGLRHRVGIGSGKGIEPCEQVFLHAVEARIGWRLHIVGLLSRWPVAARL